VFNRTPLLRPTTIFPLTLACAAAWLSPLAHAQCPLSFSAPVSYEIAGRPFCFGMGDFNADGWVDMAVGKAGVPNVAILLGNPPPNLGTFQVFTNTAAGGLPLSIVVADLNGDGKADLATANTTTVSILLGNGDGTFQEPVNYTGFDQPRSIATGDFNGDGRPDLAVADDSGNNVSILLGNAPPNAGSFQPPVIYPLGARSRGVVVSDFNRDGKPDLAVTKSDANAVATLLGNGDGTFQTPVDYAVAYFPMSIAVGDFNADGQPDLVANSFDGFASVLLASPLPNFLATFEPAVNYLTGASNSQALGVGDLNADGRPDVAVFLAYENKVSILLGNPPPNLGTFQTPGTFFTAGTSGTGRSIAVNDLNGDGRPDLAVADTDINTVVVLLNTTTARLNITQQPARTTALNGQSASFSVIASGSDGPITYQWRKDGVNLVNGSAISGANSSTLTINPVALTDTGAAFDCFVSSACGSMLSRPAGLTVESDCPADFNNDGVNDFFDYLDFVQAFSAGC